MKFSEQIKESAKTLPDRREYRQAQVLQSIRERTRAVYRQWTEGAVTEKALGLLIRRGEADINLIQMWKKGHSVCCLLCVRKGKRCICRRVKGTPCVNCLCQGECAEAL